MSIISARTKKQLHSEAAVVLFKLLDPIILDHYKTQVCAKCGGKLPEINKIEDFPLVEFQPYFDGWEDEEGDYHSVRALDLCIQEIYCENDHENILQIMIPYDLILDYTDEETFNNIMTDLGRIDRA